MKSHTNMIANSVMFEQCDVAKQIKLLLEIKLLQKAKFMNHGEISAQILFIEILGKKKALQYQNHPFPTPLSNVSKFFVFFNESMQLCTAFA